MTLMEQEMLVIFAFNEIMFEKFDNIVNSFQIYIDGNPTINITCDAILISTAMGSTGYNNSLGGALMIPGSNSMILNFVSPITTLIRSIVIHAG